MNRESVKRTLREAYKNLLSDQPDFGNFTTITDQRELNIAHHYANYILESFQALLPKANLSCDFDVNKGPLNKRPDIIVHERGSLECQLIVVEIKINGTETTKEDELDRIKRDWFTALGYRFGAYINIDRETAELLEIEVLANS